MIYDFDKVIDRSNNNAVKLMEMEKTFNSTSAIPLWIADMDFSTAPEIVDAIAKRVSQGIFGYTARPKEYYDAIISWQEKRNGWRINKSQIGFAPGIVFALKALIRLLSEKGDKVLVQTPVYPPFMKAVELFERKLVINELIRDENGRYNVDFEDFEKKISDGVKLFILCSPHNPVGRVWNKEELEKMALICKRYNCRIVSDEIHSDLMLFNNKHIPTASISKEIADITFTCISPSKTFNLAGLQAASVYFPDELILKAYEEDIKKNGAGRNNCISVPATIAAYEEGEPWLNSLIEYLEGNLKYIKEYIDNNIKGAKVFLPEATYLLWIDFSGLGLDNQALKEFLINKAGLALNDGESFGNGGSGFYRLNAACPRSVLNKAMEQLKAAVLSL